MRIKKLLIIALIVLLPSVGWGATYYCKKIGAQWKYRQDAWPDGDNGTNVTDIQAAMDAVDGSTPANSLVVYPGSYSGTDLDSGDCLDSSATNLILRGPNSTLDSAQYVSGSLEFSGSGVSDYVVRILHSGWTIQYFSVADSASNYWGIRFENDVDVTVDYVNIYDCDKAFRPVGDGTYTGMKIYNNTNTDYTINPSSDSAAVFHNCLIYNNAGPLVIQNTSDTTYNQCIILGNSTFYGRSGYSASATLNNCIVGSSIAGGYWVDNQGSGAITVNNCAKILQPHTFYDTRNTGGGTITDNNTVDQDFPSFTSPVTQGRIFLFIDDGANYSDFVTMANTAMNGYGWGVCFSHQIYNTDTGDVSYSDLANRINEGHEVACHCWYLYEPDGYDSGSDDAIEIYSSRATDTLDISISSNTTDPNTTPSNGWTGFVNLRDANSTSYHGFPVNFSGEYGDPNYQSVKNIVDLLDAISGITCTGLDSTGKDYCKAVCLNDCNIPISNDPNTPDTLEMEDSIWKWVEIYEAKHILEEGIQTYIPSWTCETYVYPRGRISNGLRDYLRDTAGFSQARQTTNHADNDTFMQYCINPHEVWSSSSILANGLTEAQTRQRVNDAVTLAGIEGLIIGIHAHGFYGTTEAQWNYCFQELKEAETSGWISIDTFDNHMDALRSASDHIDPNTGNIYSCSGEGKTCITDNSNFTLLPSSPCIDAGANLGATYKLDYSGYDQYGDGRWDIGAYRFLKWGGIL